MLRSKRRDWVDAYRRFRASRALIVIAVAWIVIVGVVLLWQTFMYKGFMARIGEWQYQQFGQQLPVLTPLAIFFLLGIPAFLVLRRERNRSQIVGERALSAVSSEVRFGNALFVLGGAALLWGVATLLMLLTLPSASGPVQLIDRAHPTAEEGHVRLAGTVLFHRTATYEQNVLFLRGAVRFAPVLLRGPDNSPVRYFVELSREQLEDLSANAAPPFYVGVLRKNALPGPVERLFGYAGFQIERPHYVLFSSVYSMRLPFYSVILNCLVAALLFFALAFFQRRRIRQTRARADQVSI